MAVKVALLIYPGSKVKSVLIVSGASPEGRIDLNRNCRIHGRMDPSEVQLESRGVDWRGLYDLLQRDIMWECQRRCSLLISPE